MTLKILLLVPSWNQFINHSHWVMVKEKKKWEKHVWMAGVFARAGGHLHIRWMLPVYKKRKVRITSYRKRLIDKDNLCLKPVMDALVKTGFLKDDSPKWCESTVSQRKCEKGEEPYTAIELEQTK